MFKPWKEKSAVERETDLQLGYEHLQEDEIASLRSTARLFRLCPMAFSRYLQAKGTTLKPSPPTRGGLNKILDKAQTAQVYRFIRSCIDNNQKPTKALILSAISRLRGPQFQPPSDRWFTTWWKAQQLHRIRTKPLSRACIEFADVDTVRRWFKAYKKTCKKYAIGRRRKFNFDETNVRTGCPKGEQIYVPMDVNKVRTALF